MHGRISMYDADLIIMLQYLHLNSKPLVEYIGTADYKSVTSQNCKSLFFCLWELTTHLFKNSSIACTEQKKTNNKTKAHNANGTVLD